MKSTATKQLTSLATFMKDRARAGCAVCCLPVEVRRQLGRPASKRGFTREDQVEWLRTVCGESAITVEILATHLTSKHDTEEDLKCLRPVNALK